MPTDVLDAARKAMKDSLDALESEQTRLEGELARVKGQAKDVRKAYESLSDTAPKRRRGRPRKSEQAATNGSAGEAEAAAAA